MQQGLKDLSRAIHDSFKEKGPPKFKKRGNGDGFRFPQGVKVEGRHIYLPKLGHFKFFKSREIEGQIKNVSIVLHGGYWYVSIQTELECADPIPTSTSAIGIDLGIKRFATLSNGKVYHPLSKFSEWYRKLTRAHQKLSRKEKFSNNWKKQKKRLARLYAKIADTRSDHLHKISTEISKNHAIVFVEDLQIKRMSSSASAATESPNQVVKRKSALNRAILSQGWYEFRRQLVYKLAWRGGHLLAVDPKYTSQTCPECSYCCSENRPSQAVFKCLRCGHSAHADFVGASNILAVGHTVSAYGETWPTAAMA